MFSEIYFCQFSTQFLCTKKIKLFYLKNHKYTEWPKLGDETCI